MRIFKKLILHIFTIASIISFFFLYDWQDKRSIEKKIYNDNVKERVFAPALTGSYDDKLRLDQDDMELRHVRVRGVVLGSKHITLSSVNSTYGTKGKEYVFVLSSNELSNRFVLVSSGWSPNGEKDRTELFKQEREVVIEGYIRYPKKPNQFVPDNNPVLNEWHYINSKEIGEYLGFPSINVPYIVATKKSFLPGYVSLTDLPYKDNPHKGYALMWLSFLFLSGAFYIYLLYVTIRKS